MTKKTENIVKGMGAGMAAGMAVGIAGTMIMKNKNKSKKMFGKAITKIEDVLDNMQEVFS